MKHILYLENLTCADCAAKIEEKLKAVKDFDNVNLDFVNKKLKITTDIDDVRNVVQELIDRIEDGVNVLEQKPEENKKITTIILFTRMGISAILLTLGMIFENNFWLSFCLCLTAYLIIGYDVLFSAAKNILKGKFFDEMFLMSVATIGALVIKEFPEAVAVMLFYKAGEFLQDYAINKSRRSIKALASLKPDFVNVMKEGVEQRVRPEKIEIGDIIVVRAGERIALDGFVLEGETELNTAALTGESAPRFVKAGDEVLSGSVNIMGIIKMQVTKKLAESTVSKIMEMVENMAEKKAKTEKFITKFSKYYTPAVVGLAVLIAISLPLIFEYEWSEAINRALIFLVVSCPCALVVSIPLSFFAGIGGLSKIGVLVKGSNYIEELSKIQYVVFDKTGTLTKGIFEIVEVCATQNVDANELIRLAAFVEKESSHPIARAISSYYKKGLGENFEGLSLDGYAEKGGSGISAVVNGDIVLCGNKRLMQANNIDFDCKIKGTIIFVAKNGIGLGYIVLEDVPKEDSMQTISLLKKAGIKTAMLTGDNFEAAQQTAKALEIDEFYCDLLPQGKVEVLEKIYETLPIRAKLAFVGDGINDSPVLARADVGIAMGGAGSEAAVEAADAVIADDSPSKLVCAIKMSKRAMSIIVQNIVFALSFKFAVLGLAAFGIVGMWVAVLADVGVSLLAILNSLRALRAKGLLKQSKVRN